MALLLDLDDYRHFSGGLNWEKGSWFRPHEHETKRQVRPKPKAHPGFVYLLKGDNYHKIGLSRNVSKRLKQIQSALPFATRLICSIPTEDMHTLEAELHERFADKRANGEWFELDEADVAMLKELADD